MRNVFLLIVLIKLSATTAGWAQHWPQWRGPTQNGVSAETQLPDAWNAECAATPTPRPEIGGPSADAGTEQRRGAPAGQNFEDVPASNTFYTWIQRLSVRAIMSGYPCGGPGEPCHAGNLPYFRWANSITRGQTSKIVSNTFFPNCRISAR